MRYPTYLRLLLMAILLTATPAAAQQIDRVLLFHDLDLVDLCSDRAGNVYMLAEFHGTAETGGRSYTSRGEADLLLVKILPDGSPGWARQIGGPNNEMGGGVAADSMGNIAVVGSFEAAVTIGDTALTGDCADLGRRMEQSCEDIFVARYASDGDLLWGRRGGGFHGDRATSVAAGNDGSIYLTGFIQGDVVFETSAFKGMDQSLFITCYDSMGKLEWVRHTTGTGWASGSRIALRGTGIWVAGSFNGAIDFHGISVEGTGENGDALLIATNTAGASLWAEGLGGSGFENATGVAADEEGNVYMAGSFTGGMTEEDVDLQSSGGSDIMVASFDPSGRLRWLRGAGGAGDDRAGGIMTENIGTMLVAGTFSASVMFGTGTLSAMGLSDIFLLRFDQFTGAIDDGAGIGGSAIDIGRVVVPGVSGEIFLGGTIQNDVQMGGTMQSAGNGASFVARLRNPASGVEDESRDGRKGSVMREPDELDLSFEQDGE